MVDATFHVARHRRPATSSPARASPRRGPALGRIGAPYGQYLLDDVLAGKVHAKLYVFLDAWRLTAEQATKLQAGPASVRVWCYTPPEVPGDLTDLAPRAPATQPAWASFRPTSDKRWAFTPFGLPQKSSPLSAVEQATPEETLFTYPDGKPAAPFAFAKATPILRRRAGPHQRTPPLRRPRAGVHLFTQKDCNVYANGPFLVLHADHDGALTVDPGHGGALRDVLTKEVVPPTMKLHRGETRILQRQ